MNLKTLLTLLSSSLPAALARLTPIPAARWQSSSPGRTIQRHTVGLDDQGVWLKWEFADGERLQVSWSKGKAAVRRNNVQVPDAASIGLTWTLLPLRATVVVTIKSTEGTERLRAPL